MYVTCTYSVELEVESSSLNEDTDLLSSSLNSDSLRPRTQSDVASLPLDSTASMVDMRLRPRTYNEAVAIQHQLQQHIQQQHNALLGDSQKLLEVGQRTDNVLIQDTKRQHYSDTQSWNSTSSAQLPGNSHLRRERISSAREESQSKPSVKQQYRLSTPIESYTWKKDSQHRASPRPADKHQGKNVHIKVTSDTAERPTLLSSMKSMLSPRPARKREDQSSIQHSSSGNHLTVPTFSQRTSSNNNTGTHSSKDNKHASNSSLSSGYFGGSSRSGTTSPITPEPPVHNKWYLDTPPETPPSSLGAEINSTHDAVDLNNELGTFHRTSSLHRPLGIAQVQAAVAPPQSPHLPQWQQQRWKHWEEVAKQRSDELKQQETLV